MGVALLSSIVAGVQYDLRTLHGLWMAIAFPQLRESHPVMGQWHPETTAQQVTYRLWSVLGGVGLLVGYPLTVFGFAVRFYVRRFDRTTTRIGILGTVVLAIVVWGGLTALARLQFSTEGFLAVAAAGTVAVVATVLALVFSRVGGRLTTVVVAYPFAVVAVFLPPVVAALYSPTLAGVVFPESESLAIWLLDNVLVVGDLNALLRARFDLAGFAYVGMWTGLAVPIGWTLGFVVTLANLVRPSDPDADADATGD
jgi:hypothetical protein